MAVVRAGQSAVVDERGGLPLRGEAALQWQDAKYPRATYRRGACHFVSRTHSRDRAHRLHMEGRAHAMLVVIEGVDLACDQLLLRRMY